MTEASYALLSVIGGVALLLWGLRMVKSSATRGFGSDLKRLLGRAAGNRFTATFAGMIGAIVMQSSTATILLASGFVANGFMGLISGLSVALGADVGSALAAQILTMDIKAFAPVLVIIGFVLYKIYEGSRAQNIGRGVIGLAIVFIALEQIVTGSAPMRDSDTLKIVFHALDNELVLSLMVGALVTFISHSSLATVLLIVSLVGAGTVSPLLGLKLVLGANLGAALPALLNSANMPIEGRRVAIGNLIFRLVGVLSIAAFVPIYLDKMTLLGFAPGKIVIIGHLVFNLLLLVTILPFMGPVSRMVKRITELKPTPEVQEIERNKIRHLDPEALKRKTPFRAIENARRQALIMGDLVFEMVDFVGKSLGPKITEAEIDAMRNFDDEVDELNNEIKFYITEIRRCELSHEDSRKLMTTFSFVTNMEHIGDIIDRNILNLSRRKLKEGMQFSKEGELEILAMHDKMRANLELCISAFMGDDEELAQELIEKKRKFRVREAKALSQHLDRLQKGVAESIDTSSIHMDLLRDFKRINSHITAVAYAILDTPPDGKVKKKKANSKPVANDERDAPDNGGGQAMA